MMEGIVFGPVPSRRLGRSLGINNLPGKICTYSCIYCQAGRTKRYIVDRVSFYNPRYIVEEVARVINRIGSGSIDYITFVPNGEPTIDSRLGETIKLLKECIGGMKIAVITNSSLLWRPDVRKDLMEADYVSLKIDCVEVDCWRRINRPHRKLDLRMILDAIRTFSKEYSGKLVTETMLVHGVNTGVETIRATAEFIASLENLSIAYLSVPTRPPTEPWVRPPSSLEYATALEIYREIIGGSVGELSRPEEGYFGGSYESALEDILATISVHPLPIDKIRLIAEAHGEDPDEVIEALKRINDVEIIRYMGKIYFRRRKR